MLQTRVEKLQSQETDVKEMIDIIKEMDPALKLEVKGILKGIKMMEEAGRKAV